MPEQASENNALVAGLTRFLSDQISIVDRVSELKLLGDLAGGAIQHNFAIDVAIKSGEFAGHHRLVVRADAPSTLAASHSRAEEFAVLQLAFNAGVSVPEPLWCCDDTDYIGRAFFIMRRLGGVADARQVVAIDLDDTERRRLLQALGSELARLHKIQPGDPSIAFLKYPEQPVAGWRIAQYRERLDQLHEIYQTIHPALEFALRWLELNAPAPLPAVLCHGDYRTGNYLVENGRLNGILDWEFAGFGDPDEDLGWICCRCWRFGQWQREVGGIGPRRHFYHAYERINGRKIKPERIAYWEIMGTLKWALLALEQGVRHVSGDESSLELALTGRMVVEMEFDLLTQIEKLS